MEKYDEVKGSGNSYTTEFRMLDVRLGRWWSVDPVVHHSMSPYNTFDNNPVFFVDPNGASGVVTLDKSSGTATVEMHLVYYGSEASEDLAKKATTEIQEKYNDANGTINVGGTDYDVVFNITYSVLTTAEAALASELNNGDDQAKYNFIRVEDNSDVDRSFYQINGNSGFFITSDNIGSSTTAPHEMGHGFGLGHSPTNQIGQGTPDIMSARGTLVDAQYQYNRNAPPGSKGGTVNPKFRSVQQNNINDMFSGVTFINGKASIGKATNVVYNSDGLKMSALKKAALIHILLNYGISL